MAARWPLFLTGLRVLLVSGGLFTVLMLIDSQPSPRWKETTQARLQLDEAGTVVGIAFDGATPDAEDIEAIRRLTTLQFLDLSGSPIEDELIDAMGELRGLRTLSVSRTQITDDQLSRLPEMPQLFRLDLSHTERFTEGLLRIPATDPLVEVDVSGCPWMTDQQVEQLWKFPGLQSVGVARTPITDAATLILAELPELRWIDLEQCSNLTDRTLVSLNEARNLKSLTLPCERMTLKTASEFLTRHPDVKWNLALESFPECAPISAQHFAYCNEYPQIPLGQENSTPGGYGFRRGSLLLEDNVGLDYSPLAAFLSSITILKLSGAGVDDRVMTHVRQMKKLVSLDFSGSRITDAGCSEIGGLQNLESVDLSGTLVTDTTLHRLADLPELKRLKLAGTGITNAGLKELAVVTLSGELDLSSTLVTGDGLRSLNGSEVSVLRLADTKIKDDDLESLKSWPRLHTIDLSGMLVTGSGLTQIHPPGRHFALNLSGSAVSDETVVYLAQIPNLSVLSLAETEISGATLTTLATCSLYSLDLAGTTISDDGMISVCSLPQLTSLDLTGAVISSAGWNTLANSGIGSLKISPATTPLTMLANTPLASKLTSLKMTSAEQTHFDVLPDFSSITSLTLDQSSLSGECFAILSRMSQLDQLILRQCTVAPHSVSQFVLQDGITLKRFTLTETAVSEDELGAFRDAFPDVSVYVTPKCYANRTWPE